MASPRERRADESEAESADGEEVADEYDDTQHDDANDTLMNQLVRKFVRYALACEYSRVPIRREAIREKVLGTHNRAFKSVFQAAQKQLNNTFSMEIVEWPPRDRDTLTATQRRKAASKSQAIGQTTTNAFLLLSTLPDRVRLSNIWRTPKMISQAKEATYIGLCSILVSIITLSGGELSQPRLNRHLDMLNAASRMPSGLPGSRFDNEKTETVLQRMVKQGYLVRVVDSSAEEGESVKWYVGPRGKMEIHNEAVAEIVRKVYGGSTDDLETKLQTSLNVRDRKRTPQLEDNNAGRADADRAAAAPAGGRGDGSDDDTNEAGPSGQTADPGSQEDAEEDAEEDGEENGEWENLGSPYRTRIKRKRPDQPESEEEDIYGATPPPPRMSLVQRSKRAR